ncbi:MAG: hypothetical protein JWO72_1106 [Caulobacteraceae bacterium]|nr:hypothetical protein [Caulobacteraceae bacterium]
MTFRRRFSLATGAVLLGVTLASAGQGLAAAAEGETPMGPRDPSHIVDRPKLFTADDQLVLEVSSDHVQLTDEFGAYASRAGLFLPLGELSRLLDLAIGVNPAIGRAEGSILTPSRGFLLDLNDHRARSGDRSVTISDAQAMVFEGDIYVRADLLEQLLPLKFKADLHQLQLSLVPTEKFPFQERLAREQRRDGLTRREDEAQVLRVETPYALFTPPAVDINVITQAGNHQGSGLQYELNAAGDLAYSSFRLFAGSDDQARLDAIRILMERKDPAGRAVGLPGLTRASVGDTYTPYLALGARSAAGRGFALTNDPLERASVFDKINLRGDLPSGYEVELYVNEVLRASMGQSSDGRYDFEGVDLSFGLNTIRLVFYGPRGERREEVQRFNVGSGALAKGQFIYGLGAVQQNVPVIPVGRDLAGAGVPGYTDPRIVGSAAYGLTRALTLTAAFARYTPAPEPARDMASVGLATSAMGFAVQAVAAADDRRGSALSLAVAGRPLGISTLLRHAEYSGGFIDESTQGGDNRLQRDTTLNLDFNAPLRWGPWPMSVRVVHDQFADGGLLWSASTRMSKPVGRFLVSNDLEYESLTGNGPDSYQLSDQTDVSVLVRRVWQVRGGASFDLSPSTRLNSLSMTIQRDIAQRTAIALSVTKTFGPHGGTTLQAANVWRLQTMDLSLTAGYASEHRDFTVGLQVSMGLLFDPFARRYRMTGPGAATGGAAAIQAFADINGDGRRQANEPGVPGIESQGGRRPTVTDARGQMLVSGLGDTASARVYLDTSKLDDPYLTPPPTIIELTPRPGRTAMVSYPLVATSEVEIQVLFTRPEENPRGLSALQVQVVSASGAVAAEGRTAYDGTVLLEGLRPGVYVLRIEPEQARRLHLDFKTPVAIAAGAKGGFMGRISAEAVLTAAEPGEQQPTSGPAAPLPAQTPTAPAPAGA